MNLFQPVNPTMNPWDIIQPATGQGQEGGAPGTKEMAPPSQGGGGGGGGDKGLDLGKIIEMLGALVI